MSTDIFKQAFDFSPVGIGIVDKERKLIYANNAYYTLHGYIPEQMANQDVTYFIHPDDIAIQRQVEHTLFTEGTDHYRMEVRIRHKENKLVWVLIQGYIVRNETGDIKYGVGFFTDITEKKKQEQELLIKSYAIDSSLSPIVMINLEGFIFYVNQAFLSTWGYENVEEIIGKRSAEFVNSAEKARENFQKIPFEGGLSGEEIAKKKDGSSFYVRVSASLVKDNAGNPLCMMGSFEDITLHKKYDEELRIKSQALASSKAGVFITNTASELIYVNKAFLAISGYADQSELLGKHATHLKTFPDQTEVIRKAVLASGLWQGEMQFVQLNGSLIDVELFTSLIFNTKGEYLGSMTWITDISERKQSEKAVLALNRDLEERNTHLLAQEEELRLINEELSATVQELHETQAELEAVLKDLQHKNFELDQFVYKTSHDLRAPLTTILGLVDIMKKETDEVVKNHYVNLIENRIQRLDKFIKSMLDYSRNVRSAIVIEPVALRPLLEECMHELEYMKNFSRLHISLKVPADYTLNTDGFRLKIIFNNIISNAIKYQNTALPESRLDIQVIPGESQVTFVFTDNGIGIKQEYLERIYDMFFRATENADGSGLGLYIVKQAIQALQGTISIKSEPGIGTESTILLPNR